MSAFCNWLFLDPDLEPKARQSTTQEPGSTSSTFTDPWLISASTFPDSSTSSARTEPKLSYSEKRSAMFDKELKSIGIPKKANL
jgi:hypothetical protein